MKVHNNISGFSSVAKTVVTIGTFDGVHSGHRKIIETLLQAASGSDESVILTFFPHPRMILGSSPEVKLLNTLDEKIMLLEREGIDHLVVQPFDQQFASLSPERFVSEVLVDRLNARKVIIGYDHRFGKGRAAGIDDLVRFGQIFGFDVQQIPAQQVNELAISSTIIRNALDSGDIGHANKHLGYPYFLSGIVVEGRRLGRTIGFPTANLKVEDAHKQIPGNGVYVVSSDIDGQEVFGVMNIGTNPTVGGTARTLEVYFLDCAKDLYNLKLTIRFLSRIRDEKKFSGIDTLKQAIAADVVYAREFLTSH